ncbi:hypothetical protein AGABI1DRAFT_103048 [Agaricus bisporus var. burnettii JB137-S8]|uniref:Uncharacterized protein n=1 Tax=Agaricus bisporus var. burnettii (strain JB137-S8 / ATCC MYA-4627 / FGSC 10392) TaxID=597362 RepID=K5WWW0_AGABU|nr:uncharacterized protein AGABI1DRAFT_103048 [Agaricus bisporus var. burnettii JB137-S8]EKM75293.1 hypothetical protein AGABI1DRAFT_103048 [Agaricus bisporus var. burnettii JB137-S8]
MADGEPDRGVSKTWLSISVVVGTSLAIGIPVLMLRRAKAASLKLALDNPSAAPPPRRAVPSSSSSQVARSQHRIRALPTSNSPNHKTSPPPSDWDTSSSLLAAISNSTASNALLAGKAFLIATTLVGVGAFAFVSTVQYLTGAYTVPDFARRMRYLADKHLTGLKSRIYRGPENEEERKASREAVPFGSVNEEEEWSWEEAEKRLKKAYDEGGFTLWSKVALRELEAEARIERARRRRESVEAENARS